MFHPKGPTFFELARQALSSTERGYDLLAPKFDFTPFRTPRSIIDAVGPYVGGERSIDSALDLCCGTGAAMRMLRPKCRRRVVGIDFSRGMLGVARQALADTPGDAAVELVHGDVLDMPWEAEFDAAVCFGALGHILPRDEPRFVSQIHKVLRPGGRFLFPTTYLPPHWSAAYWLARGFNAAMHVRNALFSPSFIMFYLTFLLPEAARVLEKSGFSVEVKDDVFAPRFRALKLVIATRR
jgi:ubiquinone/menaquinone biosynthesis C-methylase UbiE